MPDGSVDAWGYNGYGELGDGNTTTTNPTPQAVPGVSGASAVNAGDYTDFALIGGSQPLEVSVGGSGQGSVGGERIVCPSAACSATFAKGAVVSLRAEAAPGSTFQGFSGACSGADICRVTMDQARSVTATFELPKPSKTKIKAAKVNGAKRSATFSFEASGTVSGFECRLSAPKSKKGKGKAHPSAAIKFSKCASPKTYKHLKPGGYTFEVRAFNAAGHDPKPARRAFRVKLAKRAQPKRAQPKRA
jgi:hypothetical protein